MNNNKGRPHLATTIKLCVVVCMRAVMYDLQQKRRAKGKVCVFVRALGLWFYMIAGGRCVCVCE